MDNKAIDIVHAWYNHEDYVNIIQKRGIRRKNMKLCETQHSHSGADEESSLARCKTVYNDKHIYLKYY